MKKDELHRIASILTCLGNTKPSHIKLGINSCRAKPIANSIYPLIALIGKSGPGFGYGHLMRLATIANGLPKQYPWILFLQNPLPEKLPPGFVLQQPGKKKIMDPEYLKNSTIKNTMTIFPWEKYYPRIRQNSQQKKISLAVVDGRDHKKSFISSLKKICNRVILLDDYGKGRKEADLCIDALPYPEGISIPRAQKVFRGLNYLVMGQTKNKNQNQIKKWNKRQFDISIILGNEDPFKLEKKASSELSIRLKGIAKNKRPKVVLFITKKKRAGDLKKFSNVSIYQYKKDFRKLHKVLFNSKYILTYFGITMFQAWQKGTKPVLLCPTEYHYRLAKSLKKDYPYLCLPNANPAISPEKNLEKCLDYSLTLLHGKAKHCSIDDLKIYKNAKIKKRKDKDFFTIPFDGQGDKRIIKIIIKMYNSTK